MIFNNLSSAQNQTVSYVMSWDITMYDEKSGIALVSPLGWNENTHYTKEYSARIEPALLNTFREFNEIEFKLAPVTNYTPDELGQLKKLKEMTLKEYYYSYRSSSKYKKEKFIRKQGSEYIEALNYFADKMDSDILTFIFLQGVVDEKPNKKGLYDKDAMGYITFTGLIINANNGNILEDFLETYPKMAGSVNTHTITLLTDKELIRISNQFVKKLGRDYEKAIAKMEK